MPAGTTARSRVRTVVCASLAAAALVVVQPIRSQSPAPGAVGAWLTTADQEHLLAPQAAPSFAPDSGSNPLTIDVDPSTTYQVMDGFGASLTDSSAWLIANRLAGTPVNARHELLVRLFDRDEGIGLGYLRVPIGASDFALSHYTYDDVPAGQSDPGLVRFSIDHDRTYILPVLREVLSINPELRVVAAPWSAPGWMKTSGSLVGGSLRTDAESAYADYLVRFLQAYEDEGVPIERLTVQNEPRATAAADYPGMLMSATQQARLIGRHLGPALDAAGLETKVDAWDHNWDDTAFAASIFADPEASTHTAGSAWHCYAGEAAAMTSVRDRHPDKDVLVTECSGGEWQEGFGEAFAQDMSGLIIAAPRSWARAVMKWNLALDGGNGPHTGGCDTCTGLVTIDQGTRSVASFNYDYYSLGHLSKFVLRGARRIASNSFPASVENVAFRNPDGSRALVVFNADARASRTFKVREGGRAFSYTLLPRAAVTFTWSATGAPVAETVNLARNRPVLASSVENASVPPGNAVDGNGGTRWSSAFSSAPQWLQVDLGGRYSLSRIVLNWEAAFAAAYQVQVSDDGSTWTTAYSTSSGRGGIETIVPAAAATGRYLRLVCTTRTYVYGQPWGYSLWELQAFGSPAAPTTAPVNLARGRPAVASSVENASHPAGHAVDANGATRWASTFSASPQWLQVDLGGRYAISRVVLDWEAAFAAAYQLQVSDDASAWTTVYSTSAGRGGSETMQPASAATGRYLRVMCTTRTYVYGQQWGYSLWELQAFGAPAPPAVVVPVELARGRPALASSVESASRAAGNAVDGNAATRWASAYSASAQWLQVDLGRRCSLTQIVLRWEAAFAAAYQLQVSDDRVSWRTVYSTTAGRGGTETIRLAAPAAGSYLRVLCTQRTSVYGQLWGYSLWELQAFGSALAT